MALSAAAAQAILQQIQDVVVVVDPDYTSGHALADITIIMGNSGLVTPTLLPVMFGVAPIYDVGLSTDVARLRAELDSLQAVHDEIVNLVWSGAATHEQELLSLTMNRASSLGFFQIEEEDPHTPPVRARRFLSSTP